jgi:rare lipoprotein A (peptidoglycan hydrolase)
MPKFGNGPKSAALCLLIVGSLVLVAVQQVLGTAADAQTEAVVDTHELQPLPESTVPVAASPVDAAVVTGEFEEAATMTPDPETAEQAAAATSGESAAPGKSALFESGIASTYGEGDGFEGNRTACGQVFHTSAVQIAHKTLPCGTLVRVEDANTGRTIEAKVTDRGPYVRGRIVDLSWGAFKQLDPTGPGLLHVNVYLLDN